MTGVYKPKGRASEYCGLAVNIYTGCNHGCTYCYAAKMAKRWGRDFLNVEPRPGIVDNVKRQLAKETIKGKTIQLCFTCDPYPVGVDTTATRQIIEAIKNSGNHVQILTKAADEAVRDLDLLDKDDWFGITASGGECGPGGRERNVAPLSLRMMLLHKAKAAGISTWVSCEPVFQKDLVYRLIEDCGDIIDRYKIGMLNYEKSDIYWPEFGRKCEQLCKLHGRDYYIKEDLRRLMEGAGDES